MRLSFTVNKQDSGEIKKNIFYFSNYKFSYYSLTCDQICGSYKCLIVGLLCTMLLMFPPKALYCVRRSLIYRGTDRFAKRLRGFCGMGTGQVWRLSFRRLHSFEKFFQNIWRLWDASGKCSGCFFLSTSVN